MSQKYCIKKKYRREAKIVIIVGKCCLRGYCGCLNSNYCGFVYCKDCIAKTRWKKVDKLDKQKTCHNCEEMLITARLWRPYWKEVEELEKKIKQKREVYGSLKNKFDIETGVYKDMEQKQSYKLNSHLAMIKNLNHTIQYNETEDKRLDKRIDEFNDKIVRNKKEIDKLEEVLDRRVEEKEMLNKSTREINDDNNEFMNSKLILTTEIEKIMDRLYIKHNWPRKTEKNKPKRLNSVELNGKQKLVIPSEMPKKVKKKKFKAGNPSCRCVIF